MRCSESRLSRAFALSASRSTFLERKLKEHCHGDFADLCFVQVNSVLTSLLSTFTHTQTAPTE